MCTLFSVRLFLIWPSGKSLAIPTLPCPLRKFLEASVAVEGYDLVMLGILAVAALRWLIVSSHWRHRCGSRTTLCFWRAF